MNSQSISCFIACFSPSITDELGLLEVLAWSGTSFYVLKSPVHTGFVLKGTSSLKQGHRNQEKISRPQMQSARGSLGNGQLLSLEQWCPVAGCHDLGNSKPSGQQEVPRWNRAIVSPTVSRRRRQDVWGLLLDQILAIGDPEPQQNIYSSHFPFPSGHWSLTLRNTVTS